MNLSKPSFFQSSIAIFLNEEKIKVLLEIDDLVDIDALGVVVETHVRASLQGIIAPKVAGIYTLRITVEGMGTSYRKLVVE